MDIHEWLRGTIRQEQTRLDDEANGPSRQRRSLQHSDSSIIDGRRARSDVANHKRRHEQDKQTQERSPKRRRVYHSSQSPSRRSSDLTSILTMSSGPSSPARARRTDKTYERRPRHKTRHDRYEPKDKREKRKRTEALHTNKSTKRRSEHRTPVDTSQDIVRTFRAENVARHRLTVLWPLTSCDLC